MKLFILFRDHDYEGKEVVAVYSTREKAEKHLKI